jgi:hypothetical protein
VKFERNDWLALRVKADDFFTIEDDGLPGQPVDLILHLRPEKHNVYIRNLSAAQLEALVQGWLKCKAEREKYSGEIPPFAEKPDSDSGARN